MFENIKKSMINFLLITFLICYFLNPKMAVEECFLASSQQMVSKVILGGESVGFEYFGDGVLVVSNNRVLLAENYINNINNIALTGGDIIKSINDQNVFNSKQISDILNGQDAGKEVKIDFVRNGKVCQTFLNPEYDIFAKKFKLGVWVKDEITGVGTLTYINPNTGYFGALGHPITVSTGQKLGVKSGTIYNCDIVDIAKGSKGVPGELKGVISRDSAIGSVHKNSDYGVFGTIKNKKMLSSQKFVDIGGKNTIKPGKATMFCSVDDGDVRGYDIQIIKTSYQSVSNDKSFVIKIVDENLIKKTGGIVQGMSGSPIVQDGKLVGAVTHVFTNDATKGFGIYIDWML